MKVMLFAAVLAAAVLITPVCLDAGEPVVAKPGPDGVQRVELIADGYDFTPEHIVVRVNVPVELTVSQEGWLVPHNLVIDEPGAGMEVDVKLSTGPGTVGFTPKSTGSFPFYCDNRLLFFRSHREKGMEGTIEVVE